MIFCKIHQMCPSFLVGNEWFRRCRIFLSKCVKLSKMIWPNIVKERKNSTTIPMLKQQLAGHLKAVYGESVDVAALSEDILSASGLEGKRYMDLREVGARGVRMMWFDFVWRF